MANIDLDDLELLSKFWPKHPHLATRQRRYPSHSRRLVDESRS